MSARRCWRRRTPACGITIWKRRPSTPSRRSGRASGIWRGYGSSAPRCLMKAIAQFREEAVFLRESSGSTNIETTLLKALKVLKLFNIPHYVCGGFAVQEHGYPRFTVDVDVIVPDVAFAIEKLSMNGFRANQVEVNLLPGGQKVDPGPLTLPMPTHVSDQPQILTLEKLI